MPGPSLLAASLLATLRLLFLAAAVAGASLSVAAAQGVGGAAADSAPPAAVRTDSPRETLASFLRLQTEMEEATLAYLARPSFAGAARLAIIGDEMSTLVDLESAAAASRREIGIRTITYLMDIFGRIDPIPLEDVPDQEAMEAAEDASVRLPGTPLYVTRVADGVRQGEYLFAASTIDIAPRFFSSIRATPLRSRIATESYTALGPQLTGPLFPQAVVRAMPEPLKRLWLDTPLWKGLAIGLALAGLAVALGAAQRALGAVAPGGRLARLGVGTILPLLLLAAATVALPFVAFHLNLSGRLADAIAVVQTLFAHIAYGWLFWNAVRIAFEWIILSPRISEASLDANLLRLVSGVIGIVGVVVILAFGGQAIGLPILSVLAGLGIGGLAVALALRPTLENLVGGVMLYADRPLRVGDFCSFGDVTGVVENIGVRSTTLRALDRTQISVPNAQLADMRIVNFAHCDQMLISETLGVRYETTPDQLRFLLAGIRRMLHAHPRIDSGTVRARFAGYGESALKIELRAYAMTREWNDFFAVREDVFLRIYDIVAESGAQFAFPSQTVYLARDAGPDAGRRDAAETAVENWRRTGGLPFPRLSRDEIERIEATLDYPPRGSAERGASAPETGKNAERLSAEEDEPEPAESTADPTNRKNPG